MELDLESECSLWLSVPSVLWALLSAFALNRIPYYYDLRAPQGSVCPSCHSLSLCVVYACLLACEDARVCMHECIRSSMNIKDPAICPCRVQLIAGNVYLMQSGECHLMLNSCDFCLTKEPFSLL